MKQRRSDMMQEMDDKLRGRNGMFDEDLHNKKREVILKKAQNAKASLNASQRSTLSTKRSGGIVVQTAAGRLKQ